MAKKKPFISEIPEILNEWDFKSNEKLGFDPEKITTGCSSKKVIWICPKCGKSYNKTPYDKIILKYQCPYCGHNKKSSKTYNFATERPEIAKEWDYKKNYPIKPEDISPQSCTNYWWLCFEGHSYQATPNNRYKRNSRCNICYKEVNSLANKRPDLIKEWHPTKNGTLTPNDVTFGKHDKVWWFCPACGYEWRATITNRAKGRGCPECRKGTQTSTPEQLIYHYAQQLFPDTKNRYSIKKMEMDVFIPSINIGIEYDGEGFHNSKKSFDRDVRKSNLISNMGIKLIRIREASCYPMEDDICEIYTIKRECNYSTLLPILNKIFSKLSSSFIEINSADYFKVANRIKSNLYKIPYKNSLAYYMKQLEITDTPLKYFWDYKKNSSLNLFPQKVTKGSRKEAYWVCKNNPNHKSFKAIYRVANGEGCEKCAGRNKTTEEWIKEARKVHDDRYDYSKVKYINTTTKVTIICKIHGEFFQNPTNHLSGNNCPYCAGQGGFHPLDALEKAKPDLAKEWAYDDSRNNGLTPKDVSIRDHQHKYYWKCTEGKPHNFAATISKRIAGMKCAVCRHSKQISKDTCVATLYPHLLSEWDIGNKTKLTEVSAGSEIEMLWKCPNHNHPAYKMPVCQRVKAKYGCKICAGKKRTHESFSEEVANKFPYIRLISGYIRSDKPIECLCTKCGYKWSVIANNLLKSKGCKKCREKNQDINNNENK